MCPCYLVLPRYTCERETVRRGEEGGRERGTRSQGKEGGDRETESLSQSCSSRPFEERKKAREERGAGEGGREGGREGEREQRERGERTEKSEKSRERIEKEGGRDIEGKRERGQGRKIKSRRCETWHD